ncbi:hypothetical protein BD779DRAFT_1561195 [Infundibulicybe gibba]|nr:hypothetical protein BD779DRAFT_1561195 [Infundibulicybe gibba]
MALYTIDGKQGGALIGTDKNRSAPIHVFLPHTTTFVHNNTPSDTVPRLSARKVINSMSVEHKHPSGLPLVVLGQW